MNRITVTLQNNWQDSEWHKNAVQVKTLGASLKGQKLI